MFRAKIKIFMETNRSEKAKVEPGQALWDRTSFTTRARSEPMADTRFSGKSCPAGRFLFRPRLCLWRAQPPDAPVPLPAECRGSPAKRRRRHWCAPVPGCFSHRTKPLLIEAAVDRLIPPDDRGPGGKDAVAPFSSTVNWQARMAAALGFYMKPPFMPGAATQGYQMPDAPAARYRAGLKAMADYTRRHSPENRSTNWRPRIRTRCWRVLSQDRSSFRM